MIVCVCLCVHACVRACVRMCVRVCACELLSACVYKCKNVYMCNMYICEESADMSSYNNHDIISRHMF